MAGAQNIGVYGRAFIGTLPGSFAVYGDLGIGVPPPCPVPPCPPAFPPTFPDYAGYFNGDVGTTTAFWVLSDNKFKHNVQNLENPMDIINKLVPKSYTYNQQGNPSMILQSNGTHYGLLAQDVHELLPQLTKDCIHPARYDSEGKETHPAIDFKTINYTELIPFLIAGMKEQQSQIEKLQALVDNWEPQGLNQNPGGSDNSNKIDVTLSSKGIVLNQNDPNPFKEHTTIQYFIPDDATNVKIIFTGMKGNILKEVELNEKGQGQLNVYASDLSSGVYTYSIVANGITIDTKKMVCSK